MQPFIRNLTVQGTGGAVLSGARPAAQLRTWTIAKGESNVWHLRGSVTQVNKFHCGQRGLLFTAPRDKGMWCWQVLSLTVVGNELRAVLGPPEQ